MKQCLECGKILLKQKNKFCDKSCAAKYNNRVFPKRGKKERICKNCGKIIDKYQNIYCDIKCRDEYQFKMKTLPRFYEGKLSENNTIRKVLIYLHGEKCVDCGCNGTWNNKSLTLQVDHKDGNSDNNNPTNLRLLCPNCHTQTPTYCGGGEKKNTKRNKYLRAYKNGVLV